MVYVGDVGFVGAQPAVHAGVEAIGGFAHDGPAAIFTVRANVIKGEDERIAEGPGLFDQPLCGFERHVLAVDQLGPDGAEHRAVGADQGIGFAELEVTNDAHGVGVTAAGGDDDLDAGLVRGVQGGAIAWADLSLAG